MAFITRCCRNARVETRCPAWRRTAWLAVLLVLAVLSSGTARAAALSDLQVERAEDGVYLTAQLELELPAVVEGALEKGIPVYFVIEADVMRERWYWYDAELVSARRYLRVAYQPLTRRWRLNVSSEPIDRSGLGVSLAHHYDSLDEVMAAVQRVARWRIADAEALVGGGRQTLRFRFRLDVGQLPRTLQMGAVGQSDRALAIERRIELTQDAAQ